MRSPAEYFRRNQKVFLAVITVLAILSFVVSDSTNGNIQDMPPILVVAAAAMLVGGAAWIIGLARDRGTEFGLTGAVIGVLLGFVVNAYRTEGPSMSQGERQRAVKEVSVAGEVAQRGGRQPLQNLDFRALMLEEADSRGIQVSDEVGLAQMKAAGMTREDYDLMKKRYGVNDALITSALRNSAEVEIMLRLYGEGEVFASPADWWEAFQKLNVRQSASVAALPVEQFVDSQAKPKEADLVALFEEYKKNYRNVTIDGRLEEGRPGFLQPPRVKASYLVANVEDFEKLVTEPTAAEIEARYKESYAQPLPDKGTLPLGPALPPLQMPDAPAGDAPGTKAKLPQADSSPGDAPAKEASGTPKDEAAKPAGNPPATPPAPEAKPAATLPTDSPKADPPKADEAKDPVPPPAQPSEDPKSSQLGRGDGIVEVALLEEPAKDVDAPKPSDAPETPAVPKDDKPAAPAADAKPAPDAPKADAPKADAPRPATPNADKPKPDVPKTEAPAADKAAAPPATETPDGEPEVPPPPPPATTVEGAPGSDPPPPSTTVEGAPGSDPPPPSTTVRPLDDELRQTIKEQLIRERAEELAKKNIRQGGGLVQSILDRARAPKFTPGPGDEPSPEPMDDDPDRLTPEQAKSEIAKVAEDLNLEVAELPFFSYRDVQDEKDHPFKTANVAGADWRRSSVADALFTPGTPLNTIIPASNTPEGLEFAIWKTEQVDAHEPKSLEEIRDQVVTTWRSQQARKQVEARAEAIVAKAREAGKPLSESLQNETITGQKDALLLDVKPTGSFSWMTFFYFGGGFQAPPPRISTIPGVDKAGEGFMKTVFKELKPGDIGVAVNADKSVYYVVQIESRDAAQPEDLAALRDRMVKEPQSSDTARVMAQQMTQLYQGNPYSRILPQTGDAELIEE